MAVSVKVAPFKSVFAWLVIEPSSAVSETVFVVPPLTLLSRRSLASETKMPPLPVVAERPRLPVVGVVPRFVPSGLAALPIEAPLPLAPIRSPPALMRVAALPSSRTEPPAERIVTCAVPASSERTVRLEAPVTFTPMPLVAPPAEPPTPRVLRFPSATLPPVMLIEAPSVRMVSLASIWNEPVPVNATVPPVAVERPSTLSARSCMTRLLVAWRLMFVLDARPSSSDSKIVVGAVSAKSTLPVMPLGSPLKVFVPSASPSPVPFAMVRLAGSSSSRPVSPCAADVSTSPWKNRYCLPETSTVPPSPPAAPPRAATSPWKPVV